MSGITLCYINAIMLCYINRITHCISGIMLHEQNYITFMELCYINRNDWNNLMIFFMKRIKLYQ